MESCDCSAADFIRVITLTPSTNDTYSVFYMIIIFHIYPACEWKITHLFNISLIFPSHQWDQMETLHKSAAQRYTLTSSRASEEILTVSNCAQIGVHQHFSSNSYMHSADALVCCSFKVYFITTLSKIHSTILLLFVNNCLIWTQYWPFLRITIKSELWTCNTIFLCVNTKQTSLKVNKQNDRTLNHISDVVLMCLCLTLLYAIKDTLKGVLFYFF